MIRPDCVEAVYEEALEGAEYEDDRFETIPDHGDTNELTIRLKNYWSTSTWLLVDETYDS